MTAHSHGGNADGSVAPIQTRNQRPWSYDPDDFGAPERFDPAWRFSDIERLRPLFAPSDVPVSVTSGAFHPEDRIAAIALQRAVPRRVTADADVYLQIRAARDGIASEHIVIDVPPQASSTVVLEHSGGGALAENVEIQVAEGASATVVSLQLWDDGAVHAASHQAIVGAGGHLKHIVVSLGGGAVRVNPTVTLAGEGSQAELFGLAFADTGQHLESQVYLHHEGRNTRGRVTYKSALQGEGARTVWVGDVLIGREASGTDSYEQNRNLVLSEGTRADSVPNLEIETGDIVGAGHASATGRFDDDQLFYLQSRGIPESEARRLVVLGFLAEVIQQIGNDDLEARLLRAVEAELEAAR